MTSGPPGRCPIFLAEALSLVVWGKLPIFFSGWIFRVSFFRKDEDLINLINPFQFEIRNLATYAMKGIFLHWNRFSIQSHSSTK